MLRPALGSVIFAAAYDKTRSRAAYERPLGQLYTADILDSRSYELL